MSHQNHTDTFTTPEWVHHAVFYQIFPERFDNGDPTNDPENVQPWGTRPAFYNYMGGDLRGIINHLDYLSDLGVTALYLNPIFHAHSNHKYNTYDYFRIDPHFGTLETYHELIKQAHQRDIRVILDGVFNHCGRGFYAFYDIVETGDNSSYRNWFHIFKLPIHPFTEKEPANYAGWWDLRSLPKFNTDHPPVRRYLLDVARYWIEQGADGWRLDVPNEIADHEFWREFRQTVKQANPEAYIVGEIWEDAHPWLDGSQFDGVMNYIWRDLCRDFFAYGKIDGGTFAAGIDNLLGRYPRPATLAQLNLLGSHDTARFITEAHNDISRLYPTILFQMTFPGAPCIYYGDEIGMQGGKDPDCRRCFPWNQQQWNHDLRAWVQRCVTLRHNNPALRTGEYRTLWGENTLYGFGRWNDEQQFVIIINAHDHPTQIDMPLHDMPLPHHGRLRDLLSDRTYEVHDRHVRGVQVPARRGVVLTRAE